MAKNYTQSSSSTQIEMNPSKPATHTIIWLHGLGANGNDFVSIVSELSLPDSVAIRFIFPHAPFRAISIYQGQRMRAWFDIHSRDIDRYVEKSDFDASIDQIAKIIDIEKGAISTEKIFLAGFSQGAAIALAAGLSYPETLGGVMSLSGCLPHAETWFANNTVNKKLPVFLAHGTEDDILPIALSEMTAATLKEKDFSVTFHKYPMAHTVCDKEVRDISEWIAEHT